MLQSASGQSWEEDLATLLGLLLSDGEVNTKTNRILFSNRSEVLHKVFREKLKKLFGIQVFTSWIDKKGVRITQVKSKEVRKFLTRILPQFRRKKLKGENNFPTLEVKELQKMLSKGNLVKKFLQAFFSGDGSVILGVKWHKQKSSWIFTRRVQVTCKNPSLKNFIAVLLRNKLGMKPQIWKKEIALERKEDIQKFAKEINFIPGVKISKKSKNWRKIEKRVLLNLVLRTFGMSLKNFKDKEEIFEHLRKLLPAAERVQVPTD